MKDFIKLLFALIVLQFFISCSPAPLENSQSLEKFLLEKDISFTIDDEGDYRIIADGVVVLKDVWIRGQLNHSGSVAIREIFSVSLLISEEELLTLSRVLLLDNVQTRIMGSWSIMPRNNSISSKNNYLVLYTVKAGLDADKDYILQAVIEAAEAAATLEKVLSPGI